MKKTTFQLATLGLGAAALLALTACSSTPSSSTYETTSAAAFQKGVPGGIVVETHEMTAKVTGIDASKRNVTLVTSDGKKTTVKCGPDVINFDQIRVGDQLKVTLIEELVVYLAQADTSLSDGGVAVVALAPEGAKPGGVMAETMQVTAKVTAIDLKGHKATLQLPDGSIRKVAVRKDVDLTKRRVGEAVVLRITETMAISVEQPPQP